MCRWNVRNRAQIFLQVFTIHALIDNKAVPLVYSFLCNKREETYCRLLRQLVTLRPTLNPLSILSDFETATLNAISAIFPEAQMIGCSFHLAQNLWRKIQKSQLVTFYRENEHARLMCKMLLALSYVPERDVQFVFEVLIEDFPDELKPIANYWEQNYVGRRLHDITPRFRIDFWNMHDRIKTDLPKSNNSLEAWHKSFEKMLDCHHPNIARLIVAMKKEQNFGELYISRYRMGFRRSNFTGTKYKRERDRLRNLAEEYTFGSYGFFKVCSL